MPKSTRVLVALLLGLAVVPAAFADYGPMWTDPELSDFSTIIVRGRVHSVDAAWDAGVIYTYVRLDVREALKGVVPHSRIVLKQTGGVVGDVGLHVGGATTFIPGEEVVVFLEVRPRDHTLYTTAMWQGKWTVMRKPDGVRALVRHAGLSAEGVEVAREERGEAGFLSDLRAYVGVASRRATQRDIQFQPPEAPAPRNVVGALVPKKIVLLGFSWHEVFSGGSIKVNVSKSPKQPGVGSGKKQLKDVNKRWNADKKSLDVLANGRKVGGTAPGQAFRPNDATILAQALDPRGEIDDIGGILAQGGAFFFSAPVIRKLRKATSGFIVTNDSMAAQNFMRDKKCYTNVMAHEGGHAGGVGHTNLPGNLMFPSVSAVTCAKPIKLGKDDKKGWKKMYKNKFGR